MSLKKNVRKNSSLVDIIYEEKLSNSSEVKNEGELLIEKDFDKKDDLLDDALKSNFLDVHNEELKSLYLGDGNTFNPYLTSNKLKNDQLFKVYSDSKVVNYDLFDDEKLTSISDASVISNLEAEETINEIISDAVFNNGNSVNVSYKKRVQFSNWLLDPINSIWVRIYDSMNPMSNGDVEYK